jgi:NAD(P)H dehydrogenase (quinone)
VRALWVLAHPDQGSLNGRLRDSGVRALRGIGWEVAESDLYRDGFDPVLVKAGGEDVRVEQEKLRSADLLVVQFPLWWYGMPAILKGWFDRVFEAGFAYDVLAPDTGRARKYGDGGLAGKRALAIVTAGDRPGSIGPRGISGSAEEFLWPLLHGSFWYTGMDALRPHVVPLARDVDAARFRALEEGLSERLAAVMDEDRIPYLPMTEEFYDHSIKLHAHVKPGQEGLDAHLSE